MVHNYQRHNDQASTIISQSSFGIMVYSIDSRDYTHIIQQCSLESVALYVKKKTEEKDQKQNWRRCLTS